MEVSVAGTATGFQSTASRVEIYFAWRRINHIHRPEERRLILQLLTLDS